MRRTFLLGTLLAAITAIAQPPSPRSHFGFNIGDNYQLATYTQTEAYFKKLAAASDRVRLVDIGKTEEGRSQWMLVVSAPGNLAQLEKYKGISQQLARAEGIDESTARRLATEGKAVVWIDGGLHATETVGAHQLVETIWNFVSRNDAETQRILNDVIILFVHANPDGQELVSNWYMRNADTLKRSYRYLPRQYQKYVGHDNNRDFYMMNMKETQNMSRQQYVEWIPQIIYNHHQTGPAGSVLAGPPYRDPFNYVYDPLVITSLDAVGAAMNNRLNTEGKPGYTQRAGSVYSTWWNGGLRTTPYYHNIVGILTEIIGDPTPSQVPVVPARLVPNGATPNPVTPQRWTFRRSIDYSVSLNYAVLDYASRNREHLLYNIWRMGRNGIDAGSRDNWTLGPRLSDSVVAAWRKDQRGREGVPRTPDTVAQRYYDLVFRDTSLRDARAYVIPPQADMPTATKFINALLYSGVKVQRSTASFNAGGKTYPAGSYVVPAAQAFRPHVLDMFEPQDHPNDLQYPGGPPVPPYDAAGWTPAFTMGIRFERLLQPVQANLETIPYGELQTANVVISGKGKAGFLLNGQVNNSYALVNDLLREGVPVSRIVTGEDAGAFYVPASANAAVHRLAATWGLPVRSLDRKPRSLTAVRPRRVGLFEPYGGSEPSGWARWILEQYHFPAAQVYVKDIDSGDIRKRFDVLLFVTGTIPPPGLREGRGGPRPEEIPEEYRRMLGRISTDTTIRHLRRFLEEGGSVLAIGSSTALAYHLKLPVRNALTEVVNGEERPLPGEKFYIPGSVLELQVSTTDRATLGMPRRADAVFARSPVFRVGPEAVLSRQVRPLAWFATERPLRSGWAWGQNYLKDGVAAFAAPVGKGTFYAFGPEIIFRGQAQGTYKFLFNQLYALD
ncbi:peptidase [Flaviaesturariibacter flavus]|uniref:Peptidase n=1 Tax=Flaviaesturariibacter flavus TaxID=2502780 RepID=A0A4R1B2I6_9BACT|nr:M14 metallopeptidase family protein [Flaviaesturariibacter flavus]TCJ12041.1 peptidase [Flaviaesturariibacter flavus]